MTFPSSIDLTQLNGRNGFTIRDTDFDRLGASISAAGDFNGDGFDDFILGAPGGGNGGQTFVIFGNPNIGRSGGLEVTTLNGQNGFVLNGENSRDDAGLSVSGLGDINNDGFDDLIIGAPGADPISPTNGRNLSAGGKSYIVFGGTFAGGNGSINLSTLDGTNGFVLDGFRNGDALGSSVSSAGDVNGDGIPDLIVGSPGADPNGFSSGQSYVVFGHRGIGSGGRIDLNSLNGNNGFRLNGIDDDGFAGGRAGAAVSSAGDFNGDGFDDLLVGAPDTDVNGVGSVGETYLVYGRSNFSGDLELSSLNGNNGFVLRGIERLDDSGEAVSSAGDINNDGFDDIIIGSISANPNGNSGAGQAYIVFGGSNVGRSGSFALSALNGSSGFVVNGPTRFDGLGRSISAAGDLNKDGIDDLIIGAQDTESSYIIFGRSGIGSSGSIDITTLNGSNGVALTRENGFPGRTVSGLGDINGDGVDDVATGFTSGNVTGANYIVFGIDPAVQARAGGFFNFDQWVKFQQFDNGVNVPLNPVERGGVSLQFVFDEQYYLSRNADVRTAVSAGAFSSGYDHFIRSGWLEGRDPSVLYNEATYLSRNPDVAAAVNNGMLSSGFQHYISFGHIENRTASLAFDPVDYLTQNPDVAAAVNQGALRSGFEHFAELGASEGRNGDLLLFEEAFYLAQNPDVAQVVQSGALSSGLEHYAQSGQREGRSPSRLYKESGYLAANPDVAAVVGAGGLSSGFEHYVGFGRSEGRAIAL